MNQSSVVKSLFGLYLFYCLSVSLLLAVANANIYVILLFEILIFCITLFLVPKIYNCVFNISFTQPYDISKKSHVFLIFTGITFVCLFVYYIGCYPGCFSSDTIDQYGQSVTGEYNNWHPAWHTLLFFTLPLKFTHLTSSIVFFQIIYFSLFMGYFAFTIYLYSGIIYAIIASAFILLGPFNLLMFPLKDVAFAITAAFSMLFGTHIYFSNGIWCKKTYRIIIFAFMLANATLFRHNGLLFTFFLLLALIFFMQKKKYLLLVSLTILFLVFVNIGVYSFFNVKKAGKRIQEIMGVPLTIITTVTKEYHDNIDEKTLYFVKELTTKQPNWKIYHNNSEGFNSIKHREGKANNEVIEKTGIFGILKIMYRCFTIAPKQSLMSFILLTRPVFCLDFVCKEPLYIYKNEFGIKFKNIKMMCIENFYLQFISIIYFRNFFSVIGFANLIMLSFVMFKTNFTSFSDLKRFLLCIPIFIYNFGTMLLSSGGNSRYYFISFLVCPIVILIMARQKQ